MGGRILVGGGRGRERERGEGETGRGVVITVSLAAASFGCEQHTLLAGQIKDPWPGPSLIDLTSDHPLFLTLLARSLFNNSRSSTLTPLCHPCLVSFPLPPPPRSPPLGSNCKRLDINHSHPPQPLLPLLSRDTETPRRVTICTYTHNRKQDNSIHTTQFLSLAPIHTHTPTSQCCPQTDPARSRRRRSTLTL